MTQHPEIGPIDLRSILNYDTETGEFRWKVDMKGRGGAVRKGRVAGSIDTKGRRQIKIGKRCYFAHRLAFLWMLGRWPANQVDHVNRDFSDNRWVNLRDATASQNSINRTSRRPIHPNLPKGVHALPSGNYAAIIGRRGHLRHIGTFSKCEEAAAAFAEEAIKRDSIFIPPEIVRR